MSVSEGPGRSELWQFLQDRVKRDLQFSNIFLVDLTVSMAYALSTVVLLSRNELSPGAALGVAICVLTYAALHVGKVMLIVHLEKQGGDARQFVGSEQLVTEGVYGWSRNPVYLISLVQSLFWSLGLICLTADTPDRMFGFVLAPLLVYAHYWGQDRLIIPNEEAALLQRHPVDFPAYCARVNRWFGRKG